jgi:DNA-binding transcriptional MocR family regulator
MFKASLYAEQLMGFDLDRDDIMTSAPYFRVSFSYLTDEELRRAMQVFGQTLREFGCGQR